MATGSLSYNYLLNPHDLGDSPSVPRFTPRDGGTNPLITAVLDEFQAVFDADAIALLNIEQAKNIARVEIGRGTWQDWAGSRIQLSSYTQGLLATAGEINLDPRLGWSLPATPDTRGYIDSLYNTPIGNGKDMTGAIWIGRHIKYDNGHSKDLSIIGPLINETVKHATDAWKSTTDSDESFNSIVSRLAQWDITTFNHSIRIIPIVKATAQLLRCSDEEVSTICLAALLHDIGKMGIPRYILHKPGPLTQAEWMVMKLHPGIGSRLVASIPVLSHASQIIETHHEKIDGSGYPLGLTGNQIPLGGRILAVVDAYAAMTEVRPYRPACTHAGAITEIIECSGTHFDPRVSAAFIEQF